MLKNLKKLLNSLSTIASLALFYLLNFNLFKNNFLKNYSRASLLYIKYYYLYKLIIVNVEYLKQLSYFIDYVIA